MKRVIGTGASRQSVALSDIVFMMRSIRTMKYSMKTCFKLFLIIYRYSDKTDNICKKIFFSKFLTE